MSRCHLYRPVTDVEGNIVPLTTITLYEAGTTTLLQQTVWSDAVSTMTPRDNPWTTSDGYIDVYLDTPQTVRIGTRTQGANETFIDDISVLPAPENMVWAQQGFVIINEQTEGWYLQSGVPGLAAWVDAADIVEAHPTPLITVESYDWSGGVLDGATVLSANGDTVTPTYLDVTADAKPSGWSFTKALQFPTSSAHTLRLPSVDFPETGTLTFLYKIVSGALGVGAAVLRAALDTTTATIDTPTAADLLNVWRIGYLDRVPSGTHRFTLTQLPGTDLTSTVLIGPVVIRYGNNMPAHDHEGEGVDSTRLGPNSEASFTGATAVGSAAKALGAGATAFGSGAQAGLNATAVGAGAEAAESSVAIGHDAGGEHASGWVAIGEDASVGTAATSAVALGAASSATGASSVALGPAAAAGGTESLAIGSGASATGLRAVALGQGASAPFDYALAIGPGVAAQAAHEARIGDGNTEVVIPGNVRMVGTDTTIGSTESSVGFFGAVGVTRPVVLGSRGGNTALASLLTYLDSIGLISNQSTT